MKVLKRLWVSMAWTDRVVLGLALAVAVALCAGWALGVVHFSWGGPHRPAPPVRPAPPIYD